MKLLFTGGHHNSALALALHMRDHYDADIQWIGHLHTSVHDKNFSAEYKEVTAAGVPFKNLTAGKFHRVTDLRQIVRIPVGFVQAFFYVLRQRPDMVVSFGGYLAAPVVFAAYVLGIPSVTHEQTAVVGKANSFIARFAKKIFITWPSSKKLFPVEKTELVGLPLRSEIFQNDGHFDSLDQSRPTIYITAGKQGSHVINEAVSDILDELLSKYNVIHQCGSTSEFNDFDMLSKIAKKLDPSKSKNYILQKYIFKDAIGSAFSKADFVVSRAGAHIVYELAALGTPTIFIPIPWVSHNEQFENAKNLERAGTAVILSQGDLDGRSLLENIDAMGKKLGEYGRNAQAAKDLVRLDAIEKMGKSISNLLQ